METGQFRREVAARQDAIAAFGELVGFAQGVARAIAQQGLRGGGIGLGQILQHGRGLGQQAVFLCAPDGEIPAGAELADDLVRQLNGSAEMAGRSVPAHVRRRMGMSLGGEIRLRSRGRRRMEFALPESAADEVHAFRQLGINPAQLGGLLDMAGGEAEARDQDGQAEAEPQQQAQPHGFPGHCYFSMQ